MVLIGVDVHAATFLEVNQPPPVVLFEVVKGWITGSTPEIGEVHRVHSKYVSKYVSVSNRQNDPEEVAHSR